MIHNEANLYELKKNHGNLCCHQLLKPSITLRFLMYLQFATAIPCFSFATRFTEKEEQCP